LISLRRNLGAIYVSGSHSLVLALSDYGGLIASSSYLEAIQNEAEDFAERVRILRDQAQDSVERSRSAKETIERARDEIALRQRELELTQTSLEGRQASLASARSDNEALLSGIEVGMEPGYGQPGTPPLSATL
jgi:peptidoglycan hydrolase CwlO-like protein